MTEALLASKTRTYLLASARQALSAAVGVEAPLPPRPDDPALERLSRVFVSWHERDRLVGCIGTLEAQRSLEDAVRHFAVQAGLHDPRTPAVTPEDLPALDCEVSVLSDPRPLDAEGHAAIGRAIEPGIDGVVLRAGSRRAVFLPVVWKMLPHPERFLEALCRKAGIAPDQTEPPIAAETFRADSFSDDASDLPPGGTAG